MKSYIFFLLFFFQAFYTQTAEQIIEKNIQVTGGLTNWKLLNSVFIQGKVILGVKEEYPVKIFQQRPNLTKISVMINKKESVIEGFDGKKGYAMNYVTNKLQEVENYKPESFDTDFIDFQSKGFSAKLLGKEIIGDKSCFKVELTKNVNKTVYYFDEKTYFLIREVKKEETITYNDYKKVGNLMMAFKIEGKTPKNTRDYVMIFSKIETNKTFPENTFKF